MLKIKCCKECPGLISSYPPGNYFCNKTMKRIKNIEILACKEIKKRHYTTIYKSSVLSDIFKRPNPKFEFIKKELKRKNISYQKLADMLKVSKSSIFKAIKTNSAYADFNYNIEDIQKRISSFLDIDYSIAFPSVLKNEQEKKAVSAYVLIRVMNAMKREGTIKKL